MPEGLYSWQEQAERSNINEHEVLRSAHKALSADMKLVRTGVTGSSMPAGLTDSLSSQRSKDASAGLEAE
jgi:hypothetical protein